MPLLPDSPFGDAGVLPPDVVIEHRPDGSIRARSPRPLGPYPRTLTDRIAEWASRTPDSTCLARRDAAGEWSRLSYATAWQRARSIGQALIDRRLSDTRTVLILSGNSLEHQLLALGAMHVGVPYAPIAPAYSLINKSLDIVRSLIDTMRPGLVFADDGPRFERVLAEALPQGVELVTVTPAASISSTSFAAFEAVPPTPAVDAAHAHVNASTVAKVLFTSGSTGHPKGVINTHGMITANLEQLRTTLRFLVDEPPILCDWLPWNHTFGGNHNVGIALYNGGSLYIDDGRPAPGAFDVTIANLRDIATTAYFNVPKGFEMLVPYLERDETFRRHFFSRLRLLFYAAAGIRPETAAAMQRLAVDTLGHPVPWVTGLGTTESSPTALLTGPLMTPVAEIGVPVAGLELKVAPVGDVFEARIKGPNVTPGYWRDEALTRASFDEEGFYKMGDAIVPVDPEHLERGFRFAGRMAEDFKLSTGTWVRVGSVRAKLLAVIGDLVTDVAVTGHGRDEVGALLFPNFAACRAVAGLPATAARNEIVANGAVRAAIGDRLARYNEENVGGSTRIQRACLLETPPSIDAGEITDKGSLNQRAVLRHRAVEVEWLRAKRCPDLMPSPDSAIIECGSSKCV